jgi:cellulose synthase/poly-beta-1,6-N-acetylglucosamine synthase-like glycosyltransferase
MDYFLGLRVLPNYKSSGEKDEVSAVGGDGVSVIIACHNEEGNIEKKVLEIRSQLSDEGVVKAEIIVVDDGSIDNSLKLLQTLESKGIVRLIAVAERAGKPNAINLAVEASQYPVLIFSDVRQNMSKGAIKTLLSRFQDADVGSVSSQLELAGDVSPARKWMNDLKLRESNKGSTTGVCGALYAIKKQYVEKLPEDTILDDLVMAMVVMKAGKRVIHEPLAVLYDVPFEQFYSGRRQGRITAGLIQLLRKHRPLLWKIGLVQLIFLYGQKYLKYTAPVLFSIASLFALFSDTLTMWHFSITVVLLALITVANPLFVAQAMKLIISYMSQLLKLEKYTKVKWEK